MSLLSAGFATATAWTGTAFEFGAPETLSLADSIPRRAGERIVLFNKWLQAHWAVVLVSLPYERARTELRELVELR